MDTAPHAPSASGQAPAQRRRQLVQDREVQRGLLRTFEVAGRGDRDVPRVGGPVDEGFAAAVVAHARLLIAEIDAALARMDMGIYGICERCGEPIPAERLAVLPYTRCCATCRFPASTRTF